MVRANTGAGEAAALNDGQAAAARIFANEADPAFRRRALWIGQELASHAAGAPFRVLDIGCGRGFYLPLYAALNATATGVELDPVPRAMAEQRARETGATILAAQAEALPFPDASFEAVVMSEILEHLDEPVAALTEARRVLVPGGLLLVTVPHADYPFFWDPLNFTLEALFGRKIRKGPFAGIWANHVRLYRPTDLRASVEKAGFAVKDLFGHTSRCLPFVHNIVYGLGKPLLDRRILPQGWAKSAERASGKSGRFNPVALGIGLIHLADRSNPEREPEGRRSQNLCLKAIS
jgi:2-polyprenyl-6-hydroxyphenyl methylase / 3-demethylubiquinone-9 3-methyltransferase